MNPIYQFIKQPQSYKPGAIAWACTYGNLRPDEILDIPPTKGLLTLTNSMEDEQKTANISIPEVNFIMFPEQLTYQEQYRDYAPRYFVPINGKGLLEWTQAVTLSFVVLTDRKEYSKYIYYDKKQELEFLKHDDPYEIIKDLHMEHPKASMLRIGQFWMNFQHWHQKNYQTDIFYVENRELISRMTKYLNQLT